MNVNDPQQLLNYLRNSNEPIGPLFDAPYLVIQGSAFSTAKLPTQFPRHASTSLPCPVLGVGELTPEIINICDVAVNSVDDLQPMQRNIEKCPLAATTLVQTLRAVENSSVEDGLLIESLAYATLQAGPEYQAWLAQHNRTKVTEVTDDGPAVLIERHKDTLTIILNRASRRNAISIEMRDALCEAFELVLLDDDIKQLNLRGNGACFSTGGDLEEFGQTPDPVTGHLVRTLRLPGRKLAKCAENVTVSAHVHSACIGAGIELAAFAHTVIAQSDSFFQLPELKFGLIPGAGGCVSLVKRIGRHKATEICLSGKKIKAKTALEIGLIDKLQLD